LDLTSIWNLLLVHPIEAALLSLTALTGSAGLAIIVFTILVRTAVLPLGLMQVRSQKAMWALQPKIKELQKRHGSDRQKFAQEQMKLFQEHGVHPLAGCFPMLVQMPIWFALYSALINLSSHERNISEFQGGFLWIQNLALPAMPTGDPGTWPLVILPILTAVTQWVVQKMSTLPPMDAQQAQMNRMMEFMPLMFLVFSFQVASGLVLYWVVSNLYSIVQQRFTLGWGTLPYLGNKPPPDDSSASSKEVAQRSTPSSNRRGGSNSTRRRKGK
jgi:YidC/Oxa1 family membrane protein insertase